MNGAQTEKEDVDHLKSLLAKQARLIEEMQRKIEESDQFGRIMSHDLRSPLHTIRGFAEIIHQDLAKGYTKTLLPDMERIIDAGNRMQSMLDGLVAFSRAGKALGVLEPVNMGELVSDVVTSLSGKLGGESVRVVVADSLPVIKGDRQRLRLLIGNLLEDALHLLEGRKESVIEVGFRAASDGFIFSVRNNGAGIPADQLDSVLSFSLGPESEPKGSGMGLAIARRIVEAHGGKMWIESEGRGKGSILFFSMPDAAASARTGSPTFLSLTNPDLTWH